MDEDEKKCWVAFNVFEGIGPLRFKLLYDYFGTAKEAYSSTREKLITLGLSEKLVEKFLIFRKSFDAASYFLRMEKLGLEAICSEEESYPKLLKELVDKPPIIYVKSITSIKGTTSTTGTMEILGRKAVAVVGTPLRPAVGKTSEGQARKVGIFDRKAIAVVGTRKVTAYGRQVTEMVTEGLVASGLTIVSGLARGVDKIAHETTIKNNGITLAVLGCGLDLIYPPEHGGLADKIVESGGAIISEFPLGMQAVPGNFPARNRIISGLSLGVVVTEAAEDSGSLITASCAAEQGREVFAVPGPITSPLSKGTSELIKKGAKLVSGVEDILEELGMGKVSRVSRVPRVSREELGDEEIKIFDLLLNENLHIDEICRKSEMDSGKVGGLLSMLEIKGIIKNFGEGVYGLK